MLAYIHCDNVTIASRVYILAHDASTKTLTGYTKIGKVEIGNNVFIGANSTILPNVNIGNNVVIGAGSVVSRDVPENTVVAGNPAKKLYSIDDYISKNNNMIKTSPVWDYNWTIHRGISQDMKDEMATDLDGKIGFVE
ncbi:acyltransferase [Terribacillus saccharophilus]|uniref:acyltransferase n=1 Tax=Terribacillus saccharophilus TaxID=361277 RepID=UPI003982649E